MRKAVIDTLKDACRKAREAGSLSAKDGEITVSVEQPKLKEHGDFSTNLALLLAPAEKKPPREIASLLLKEIGDAHPVIARSEVAGPGFINLFLRPEFLLERLREAFRAGEDYGGSNLGSGKRVQVEFVSANPTGPLHIGHGRGAVVGDSLSKLLGYIGYDVEKEYYINDMGTQMETLGRSLYLRYQEVAGEQVEFPEDAYQGQYLVDLAQEVFREEGQKYLQEPPEEAVRALAEWAGRSILADIQATLERFGVHFDKWFSEKTLAEAGALEAAISELKKGGQAYEEEGALWLRTQSFGDEKDRVVVRSDGRPTYLASDIAYHQDKFRRGFDRLINIWGADHHGYVPRLKALVQMMNHPPEALEILLVQLVNLKRGEEQISMSTRAGKFASLSEVLEEVGADATRFFLLTRRCDSHLDFDMELAKKASNENPVYYVQYAHARICSVFKQAAERGISLPDPKTADLSPLKLPEEWVLIKAILGFPDLVEGAAKTLEPHRLTFYLVDLVGTFHSYYNHHRIISDDPALTAARLYLVTCLGQVLRCALRILGISAPETM